MRYPLKSRLNSLADLTTAFASFPCNTMAASSISLALTNFGSAFRIASAFFASSELSVARTIASISSTEGLALSAIRPLSSRWSQVQILSGAP